MNPLEFILPLSSVLPLYCHIHICSFIHYNSVQHFNPLSNTCWIRRLHYYNFSFFTHILRFRNYLFWYCVFDWKTIISLFLLLFTLLSSIFYSDSFITHSSIYPFIHSSFFHFSFSSIPFLQFQKSIESNTRQNNRQIHFIHFTQFYSILTYLLTNVTNCWLYIEIYSR